jgi:hypothetical protein
MGKKTKSIYGASNDDSCCDLYLNKIMTTSFSDMVDNLYKIIDTLFPSFNAISTIEADLKAYYHLPSFILVRFIWVELYPGLMFDPNNSSHIYLLKDIYDSNELDYKSDPTLKDKVI